MKRKLFKTLIAAGAVAMICACGDDAGSNNASDPMGYESSSSTIDNPVYSSGVVDPGNSDNPNNPSSSAVGNSQGQENPASSGAMAGSSASMNPGSSDAVIPGSSDSVIGSSADVVSESSSSKEPELDASGFPTLESYGAPSAEYTKDISASAKRGWNTRYWDACKPHCSWLRESAMDTTRADTSSNEAYLASYATARNCNIHDVEVPTFTLGNVSKSWVSYEGTRSACGKEKETGVFTCTDMAPIAVNDTLAYGYVAGTAQSKCGKCYQLQYDGHFSHESETNPPKATHKALKGKHLVVMASNIGGDVAGGNDKLPAGQFDLMVPGGGVGAFDALSIQVNNPNVNWGEGFGGFLSECQKNTNCGTEGSLDCYQTCVKDMCDAAFGNAGLPNLLRGCHWFADWYMAADNPTYYIEEVECPQYLIDHYMTRFNTTLENNYKKVTDWSTYKEGDVLDTLHCWKAGEAPAEDGWTNPSAGCDVQ